MNCPALQLDPLVFFFFFQCPAKHEVTKDGLAGLDLRLLIEKSTVFLFKETSILVKIYLMGKVN